MAMVITNFNIVMVRMDMVIIMVISMAMVITDIIVAMVV